MCKFSDNLGTITRDKYEHTFVTIDESLIGAIIGMRSSVLKNLQKEYNVRITIPSREQRHEKYLRVLISGLKDFSSVEKATNFIYNKLKSEKAAREGIFVYRKI